MVQLITVIASLYFLSQNRMPARPNTKVAEITAEIMKRRSIIIGAKNFESTSFKFGSTKLKKEERSIRYTTSMLVCRKARKGDDDFFNTGRLYHGFGECCLS